MSEALIKVVGVKKRFIVGGQNIEVLKGIDLTINKGDFAVILGPSGCGKSTLLHTILGMEKPSEGQVVAEEKDLYAMSEDDIVRYRKMRIGVVFQQPIWIKSLNVIENVAFPNRMKGMSKEEAEEVGMENLKKFGLENLFHQHPSELSSGQQQRVSLARALSIKPIMIVADEPTGNLDTVSGDQLMEMLSVLNRDDKVTILMVTHDLEYLRYATKLFHIIDGVKVEETDNKGAVKLVAGLRTKKGNRGQITVEDKNYLDSRERRKDE